MLQFIVTANTKPGRLAKAMVNAKEDDIEIICKDRKASFISLKAIRVANQYYHYKDFVLNFKVMPELNSDRFVISKRYVDEELREIGREIVRLNQEKKKWVK